MSKMVDIARKFVQAHDRLKIAEGCATHCMNGGDDTRYRFEMASGTLGMTITGREAKRVVSKILAEIERTCDEIGDDLINVARGG